MIRTIESTRRLARFGKHWAVAISTIRDGNGLNLMQYSKKGTQTSRNDGGEISVVVICASLSLVRINPIGAFYITLETEEKSNAQLLCLSQIHRPQKRTPRLLAAPYRFAVENASEMLLYIICHTVANIIVDFSRCGEILVQDPPPQFAKTLERSSTEISIDVIFTFSTRHVR